MIEAFYTKSEVCRISRLSPATIWRMVKKGTFPPSVKLTEKKVGWPVDDVKAWVEDRSRPRPEKEAA